MTLTTIEVRLIGGIPLGMDVMRKSILPRLTQMNLAGDKIHQTTNY